MSVRDDILIKELTEHKLLDNLEDLKKTKWLISRYFNFGQNFKLRWYRARDLFGSQILVTIRGFELRNSSIQSSYLTHWA